MRTVWPAVAVLIGAATIWFGTERLVWSIAGPVGFDVTTTDRNGAVVEHRRAEKLLTPEVAPTPPRGGTLIARATFVAPRSGVYVWLLGGSSASSLRVDGVAIYSPAPGRVAPKEQLLAAGLHEIEVALRDADGAGGVAFGVRPPWRPWRGALAGRGEVVALPLRDVKARLGTHALALIALFHAAPALALLLALFGSWLAIGRERRARIRGYAHALVDDRSGRRFLIALALAAIMLPMLWPLLEPGFFACGEEESYIVRLGEYTRAIRGGIPMGRWWPDPVWGRGYPFLCVYAPLVYILATPLLLVGVSPLVTVKLLTGAVVVVGGLGVYGIVRRRASTAAALLAVALYVYAPYLQTDDWIREDLAEALGFACFPLALLALDKALDADGKDASRDIALLALALAALGCSHNITAYFSVFFLGLWFLGRFALRTIGKDGIRRALFGAALGFLACVFYAVPALFDSKRIWIERVMTGYYNPAGHFLSPLAFFVAEPRWQMRLYLGVANLVALILGIVAVAMKRPRGQPIATRASSRTLVILATLGIALAFVIATRPVGPLFVKWVPLANHVQFPWRLLLFAACLAPLCAPAALDGFFVTARARWIVSAACIAAIIALSAPFYGPPAPLVRSRLDVEHFLRGLETDYVTSMNEYLPKTVKRTVPRFGEVAHVLERGVTAMSSSRAPGVYRATLSAAEPVTIEFNAHWFPGWIASVDGVAQTIGPTTNDFDDGGLIRVAVPAGHHDVVIRFVRTPLRWVCDCLSGVTVLFVLVLLVAGRIRENW
ncbi:MAG TPA: 6-pyruvoyl-tetrahydropterin synthase-related protein [Polyangia bacterium]